MIITKICICGKEFKTTDKRIESGRGKFCSKKCQYSNATRPSGLKYHVKQINKAWFKKGQEKSENWYRIMKNTVPYNKGTKGLMKPNKTSFKDGNNPWNKGKEYYAIRDEKHPFWKGDNVGYLALHSWINRKLGKPDTCEHCGKTGLFGRKIHWANISGEYKRDVNDWIRLCAKCHVEYDKKN